MKIKRLLALGVTCAVLLIFVVNTVSIVSWSSFDLVKRAEVDIDRAMAGHRVMFLDRPDGRATIHRTGERRLRVVCGWFDSDDPSWPTLKPRFFYVLYQLGFLDITLKTTFIQKEPDQVSPEGGEYWCEHNEIEPTKN